MRSTPSLPVAPLVAPLLAAVASLAGCSAARPPAAVPPTVQLVQPRVLPTEDAADYQSTLEAIREVRLAPEIDGRIVAMPVFEGERVRRGQLLFVLDQVQLQAQVRTDAAEARKDRVNAERYIFLNEQGAVSTKDRDYYVTQAIQSRDRLQATAATLGYKNVVAPIDGYVGNLNAKIGDVVRAGTQVTSVVDNSRLWVRLDVPGELGWKVRPGLPVVLRAPDRRQLIAQGRVGFIAPSLDRDRQTLLVKAVFDNPDGALRNDQRVSATLVFGRGQSLSVPEQAVMLQAGQPFVFLAVSAEEARRRLGRALDPPPLPGLPVAVQVPVRLGTLQGRTFPVLAGVAPGDTLILGNLAQLRSGLSVQPSRPVPGR
ncbi:MAG: efflux RND transporter periplasmic adaptor subunit [Cyanobacteriota bacterium]|nr:efflux RND transporter periplasmic adaptor subunit [Cyanobacteriota bacterium]